MEILLALVAGTAIGIAVHFIVGAQTLRGAAVAPMIGAVTAGAAWTSLTWAGVGTDSPWPWLAAVVAPAAVCYPAVLGLTAARRARDARDRARLGVG